MTKRVTTTQLNRETLPDSIEGRLTSVDARHGKFGPTVQLDKTDRVEPEREAVATRHSRRRSTQGFQKAQSAMPCRPIH